MSIRSRLADIDLRVLGAPEGRDRFRWLGLVVGITAPLVYFATRAG